jgi:hypothetical protein
MARVWLRDDLFERIEALLPGKVSDPGCTAANNRLFSLRGPLPAVAPKGDLASWQSMPIRPHW